MYHRGNRNVNNFRYVCCGFLGNNGNFRRNMSVVSCLKKERLIQGLLNRLMMVSLFLSRCFDNLVR